MNGSGVVTCRYPQNIRKKSFGKTSLFGLTVTSVLEKKVMLTAYFKLLMW